MEYFYAANTFASPIVSRTITGYVSAEGPTEAVKEVQKKNPEQLGFYAIRIYTNADDYHKQKPFLEQFLSGAAINAGWDKSGGQ